MINLSFQLEQIEQGEVMYVVRGSVDIKYITYYISAAIVESRCASSII